MVFNKLNKEKGEQILLTPEGSHIHFDSLRINIFITKSEYIAQKEKKGRRQYIDC